MHQSDPRVKIIGAILFTILCFFITNIVILFALFLLLQLMIASTGVSRRQYFSSISVVARFAVLFILLWPFFDKAGDPVILDLSIYKITLPAFLRSGALALRILDIASVWFLLLYTTRQGIFLRGLVRLGLPYDISLSLSIALRYIPHFIATMNDVRDAQISRGFAIDGRNLLRRARNFVPLLIPTIAIAIRLSEQVALALVSKGYGARKERAYYRDIRMKIGDCVAFIVIATIIPFLIALDIAQLIEI